MMTPRHYCLNPRYEALTASRPFKFDPNDYTSFWVTRNATREPIRVCFIYEKSWLRKLLRKDALARVYVRVNNTWFEEKYGCRVCPVSPFHLQEVLAAIDYLERTAGSGLDESFYPYAPLDFL